MRRAWLIALLFLGGCAETVRCPDGQYFDRDGRCVPIPDAGPPADASPDGAQ
jgi:phenylpropionate dioxygenase-like ring-hydroxylating dioxygenase large terminal subunit